MKSRAYSYLRMSTELQLKGDSRRRQLEASLAYAEAHGLDLAAEGQLEDIGVSAFKGANVRDGALGRFLDAVQAGSIQPGSYLLVESLDRLSREELLTAHSLFLRIVKAGIHLVTLADGRVYRAGTNDLGDLIYSLVVMSRAHEESQTKSRRISAAWANKRSLAAGQKPMTKWCPAWLKLSSDRAGYVLIPQRVALVRQIFEDFVGGVGMYSIAARLNTAKVLTFDAPNGWHQSYIAKILANRAVLGEFQPHVRMNGKRVPQGEPIKDYFPAIISEELFYQAQFAKSQRRGKGAGRKGIGFTNLFSGIAKCYYCGSPILFENKGSGPKGGTYLICDGAKRRLGCASLRWRYRDFEASFLAFVEEIDVQSIVDKRTEPEARHQIEAELSALRGELSSVQDLMDKTYAVLVGGGPIEYVTSKLNELEERRSQLQSRLEEKAAEQDAKTYLERRYRQSVDEIKQLIDRLHDSTDTELFKLRAQVSSELKTLVETLLVGSVGERPKMIAAIEEAKRGAYGVDSDVLTYMEEMASHPDQRRRFFVIGFRDGKFRAVFPDENDPLRYSRQVLDDRAFGFQSLRPSSPSDGDLSKATS